MRYRDANGKWIDTDKQFDAMDYQHEHPLVYRYLPDQTKLVCLICDIVFAIKYKAQGGDRG